MATLYPKRSGWIKQPHYPVGLSPEWSSKIAFASLVGQGWNYDLKTKISPSVVGTGLSKTVGQHGPATTASDDTSGLFWSGRTPIANGNNGYAMLVFAAPVSQAEADRAIVLGDEVASNYNQITFAFNSDKDSGTAAGKFAIFEYNGGFANRADSTASQVDGNWHVFIANRDAGSTGQTKLYRDGLDVTGTQTHAAGVACTAGTSVLCSPVSTTAGFEHPASLAIVFNAPLTAAERATLSANPWVILESQARHIWVPAVGGGDSVTGNPITLQWGHNNVSVKEEVNTIPINWEWANTLGSVKEKVVTSPISWEWNVTTGTLVGGGAIVLTTNPIDWEWQQSTGSFVSKLTGNPVAWEWGVTTGRLTENINTNPAAWEWQTTTGTLLGQTAVTGNPISWEWEVTTGNLVQRVPETASTIGGKPNKQVNWPFYDKGKDYESRIDLEETQPRNRRVVGDNPTVQSVVKLDDTRALDVRTSDDDGRSTTVNEQSDRLVGDLLQELKGEFGKVSVIELKQDSINEEYDDSMVESLVVSLLLAA